MLRIRMISAAGVLAVALAVPTASGAREDVPSRDGHAAVVSVAPAEQPSSQTATPASDLRSPDVRDAAARAGTDLRSPDARDASGARRAAVEVAVPAPTSTPAVQTASNDFEWGDAGIGAAGMLAFVLLAVGVGMMTVRYRHGHASPH